MSDPMTPTWSRALAEVRLSPYWHDATGILDWERRDRFIEQAAQYATYDDLPHDLQTMYRNAARQLHHQHTQQVARPRKRQGRPAHPARSRRYHSPRP